MSQRQAEAVSKPRRRTQAERSAETKQRLLDATVDCLYELGYHRTTTYSVEQRAGVTRGALLHHFASKSALLMAAVEHMVDSAAGDLAADAAKAEGENLGEEVCDLLWRRFTSPIFFAFMEIFMAARTDTVLRDTLAEAQEALDTHCRTVAAQLLGTSVEDADFSMGLELCNHFLRGAASADMLGDNSAGRDAVYREWKQLVAPYFTGSVKKRPKYASRG